MRLIPPEIIDRIKDSISLVDYMGRSIKLKKTGATYKACCPFHNEKTPSFVVYPDNHYHCFGCGKNGDIITFVMEQESVNFVEAAEKLAAQAGIQIPKQSGYDKAQSERIQKFYKINQEACRIFQHNLSALPAGRDALQYLLKRGVLEKSLSQFKLGYALPQWESLSSSLRENGYNDAVMIEAALARRGKDNRRVYDYFRNRVIFPICNEKDDVVAFGGRIMDENGPKYLNSPETPVFQKRRVLYGLNHARSVIAKNNVAYLVEGYLDVIGLHQAGFGSAVAPLGTSLTEQHLSILKRYTNRIVFIFDGDNAGRNAVMKSARLVMDMEFSAKVVLLPQGEDAFDVACSRSKADLVALIKGGVSIVDFVLDTLYRSKERNSVESTVDFLQQVYEFLEGSTAQVSSNMIVTRAAQISGVDAQDALTDFKNFSENNKERKVLKKAPSIANIINYQNREDSGSFELYLMRLVGLHADGWEMLTSYMAKGFSLDDSRAIYLYNLLGRYAEQNGAWSAEDFLEQVKDPALAELVREDISTGRLEQEWQQQLVDTINKIWIKNIRRERQYLSEEIRILNLSGDKDKVVRMQQQLLSLRRKEERLQKNQAL